MKVKVLYFGPAGETAGSNEEFVSLPNPACLEDLIAEVLRNHGGLHKMKGTMKLCVNQEIVSDNIELHPGDEVALLPPVAGG